jgi:hypothetical protein
MQPLARDQVNRQLGDSNCDRYLVLDQLSGDWGVTSQLSGPYDVSTFIAVLRETAGEPTLTDVADENELTRMDDTASCVAASSSLFITEQG